MVPNRNKLATLKTPTQNGGKWETYGYSKYLFYQFISVFISELESNKVVLSLLGSQIISSTLQKVNQM